jgi:hypothetical protein
MVFSRAMVLCNQGWCVGLGLKATKLQLHCCSWACCSCAGKKRVSNGGILSSATAVLHLCLL